MRTRKPKPRLRQDGYISAQLAATIGHDAHADITPNEYAAIVSAERRAKRATEKAAAPYAECSCDSSPSPCRMHSRIPSHTPAFTDRRGCYEKRPCTLTKLCRNHLYATPWPQPTPHIAVDTATLKADRPLSISRDALNSHNEKPFVMPSTTTLQTARAGTCQGASQKRGKLGQKPSRRKGKYQRWENASTELEAAAVEAATIRRLEQAAAVKAGKKSRRNAKQRARRQAV